jgi:hypothetical protein
MTSLSIVDMTATSDVIASTTLPTTLVTTVTVTQVTVPPSPAAFIIQASRSGTSYDEQYIYLPQGGNPFFQFTTDITSATPFDTTSAPKFAVEHFQPFFKWRPASQDLRACRRRKCQSRNGTDLLLWTPQRIRVWFTSKLRQVPTTMHVCWAIAVFWSNVLSNLEELFYRSRVSEYV